MIKQGAQAQSYTELDGEAKPVVADVPVHVHKRSSRQDGILSQGARLAPPLHF